MAINLVTDARYEEITLNRKGDKTYISVDDATLFDRFVNGYKHIAEQADAIPGRIREIEKKYEGKTEFQDEMQKTVELSRVNVGFSEDSVKVIDDIFGKDTVRMYFRDLYEKIPTFLPNADCFLEFLERITPEMERLFHRKMEDREKLARKRMAKYQPQDHRKPQRRRR